MYYLVELIYKCLFCKKSFVKEEKVKNGVPHSVIDLGNWSKMDYLKETTHRCFDTVYGRAELVGIKNVSEESLKSKEEDSWEWNGP